jgi:hypothetical protein
MDGTTALSRVDAGSLTTHVEPEHNVFRLFRLAFGAGNCRQRKVYWVEERWGQTILRQVLDPKRTLKREDKLISMVRSVLDLDVVLLAIAASSVGQILTGVRWEVYRDFACTELLAMGRFDHIDLLGAIEPAKLRALIASGVVTCNLHPDDWDFDGILLTHRCPKCQRAYGKDILAFLPGWMECQHCGFSGMHQQHVAADVARALLGRLTRETAGILSAAEPTSETLLVPTYFLDIHATPLLHWLITHFTSGLPLRDWKEREVFADDAHGGFTINRIYRCYQRSLFPLLEVDLTREAFLGCVRAYYDRRIAHVRARATFQASASFTVADARAFALRGWEDMRQQFGVAVERVQGLSDWLFGPSVAERQARGESVAACHARGSQLCEATEWLASCGQELIEDVAHQLPGGEP